MFFNQHGHTPNQDNTPSPQDALFEAATNGDLQQAQEAIAAGANVNAQDYQGWLALHYAINLMPTRRITWNELRNDKLAIIQYFLKRGANPNHYTMHRETPLHRAIFRNDIDLIKHLVAFGADPKLRNLVGNSPAHIAAQEGHLAVIKYLADILANMLSVVDIEHHWGGNNEGRTVLDLLEEAQQRAEIDQYLKAISYRRFLYFALARHKRVGKESDARTLVDDVLGIICDYVANPKKP